MIAILADRSLRDSSSAFAGSASAQASPIPPRRRNADMASSLCQTAVRSQPQVQSLPCLVEISQIWRRLVLLGRHQKPICAQHIVLIADFDVLVLLGAI